VTEHQQEKMPGHRTYASSQRSTGSIAQLCFVLALAWLLVVGQVLVAAHAAAHVFEKSPAQQEKHENACDTCLAGHVIGAGLVAVAVIMVAPPAYSFIRSVLKLRTARTGAKPFLSTGPPLYA
jgi:hypothetical protein